MLSWLPNEIASVERSCNAVAQALLKPSAGTYSSSSSSSSGDSYPPLVCSPCGSFPLRTSIGLRGGVYHVDLSFEIPEQLCSASDVEAGRYLEIRAGIMRSAALPRLQQRFAPVSVELLAMPQTEQGVEKHILRVTPNKGCVIDVHARPKHAGAVNSAKGQRKSPQYCAQVVEDLAMVRIAVVCADIVSRCPAFAVASLLLRKWAVHCGVLPPQNLCAPGSSISQALAGGLNFFSVVTAPMLLLWHQGTIAATASNVDSIVRSVWIYWAQQQHQQTQQAPASPDGAASSSPLQLFLPTEPHLNVLHRAAAVGAVDCISTLAEAAQSALSSGHGVEVLLSQLPGRSIYERYDAVIRLTVKSSDKQLQQQQAQKLQAVIKTALASRVSAVVVGTGNSDSKSIVYFVVGLRFISEAAARSRLFRGPTIDDVAASKHFADLWGAERVSARQFGDGSIARCVLLNIETSNESEFADPAAGCRAVCEAVRVLAEMHLSAAASFSSPASTATQQKQKQKQQQAQEEHNVQLLRAELCAGSEVLVSLWTNDAALGAGSVARDPEPLLYAGRAAAVEDLREHINIIAESSLPCAISSVEFLSSAERGTDPFPPFPHLAVASASAAPSLLTSSATISPIQLVVQIADKKNKIPNNVDAIATMKSVVLAQLATELSNAKEHFAQLAAAGGGPSGGKFGGGKKKKRVTPQEAVAQAHIPASGGSKMTVHCSKLFADVLHEPSGYVFRIFILLEKELLVLQQLDRGAEAASISRALVWGQRHAEYMRGVIAQRPSVAGACRLLRRWISAMCLADYISLEVSELVVAYVCNTATATAAPSSSTAGDGASKDGMPSPSAASTFFSAHTLFLAAVRLLAFFPFQSTALVFPECDGDKAALAWGEEQRRQNQQAAAQQGNTVALRAMFIAAPYTDAGHSPFTESTPRQGVMQCLRECARTAWEQFCSALARAGSVAAVEAGVASIFTLDTSRSFNFSVPLTDQAVALFAHQHQQQSAISRYNNRSSNNNGDDDDEDNTDNAAKASRDAAAVGGLAPRFVQSMVVAADAGGGGGGGGGGVSEEESRRILSRAVDQNALLGSVRDVRRQFRDRCMVFYDECNPSQLNGVRFGASLQKESAAGTGTTASVAAAVAQSNPRLFKQMPKPQRPAAALSSFAPAAVAAASPATKKKSKKPTQQSKPQGQKQQLQMKKKPILQQQAHQTAVAAPSAKVTQRKKKSKSE